MKYEMKNFLTAHIDLDIKNKKYDNLAFRFPPEPNGCLHLGHAKSIIINSFLAKKYNGKLYLRLDDTNPETENSEYVSRIIEDSNWLSLKSFDAITYTSDYFENLYGAAVFLISNDLAYVDFSTEDEIRNARGGFISADKPNVYRGTSVSDNLKLFNEMRSGKYANGEAVLRAKIDLNHRNMNMRDPIIYRIKHASHYRTGDDWCIYPMYDFAHPLSDAIEKISHSLCTLEFADHRVLYDWYVEKCFDLFKWKPVELEFSRLSVEGVELSKRKLLKAVSENGLAWDDSRLPTVAGLRGKGITSDILTEYILKCGFTKTDTVMPKHFLVDSIRKAMKSAPKITAIIKPVKLNFINDEEGVMSDVIIERDDVRKDCEPDFWRVCPNGLVRLKNGYNFTTKSVIADLSVVEAEIDLNSRNLSLDVVKPRASIHWLTEYVKIKARFYEDLFLNGEFNVNSMIEKDILISPGFLLDSVYEFDRVGHFYIDRNGIAHHLAWLKDSLF